MRKLLPTNSGIGRGVCEAELGNLSKYLNFLVPARSTLSGSYVSKEGQVKELILVITLIVLGCLSVKLLDELPRKASNILYEREIKEAKTANDALAESIK